MMCGDKQYSQDAFHHHWLHWWILAIFHWFYYCVL